MKIGEKRKILLEKLDERLDRVRNYQDLIGPGFIKKFKRFYLLKSKYLRYSFSRISKVKNDVWANLFWGKKIKIPLNDVDCQYLYYFGTLKNDELKLIKFIVKKLKRDDIFFDIGANYGFFSLLAKKIIDEGEIHIFEPSEQVFSYLKINFFKNDSLFLNKQAVFSRSGHISFYSGFENGISGVSTINKDVSKEISIQCKKENVLAITLDEYVKGHKKPTFIKLDIEGGEYEAIKGGRKLFEENNPIISMEVWSGKKGQKFSKKAVDLLYELGYKSYFINDNGELIESEINILELRNSFENCIFKK